MENNLGSNDFSYSGTWTDYTTWADKVLGRNFLGNAVVDNTRAMLDVDVKYNFFGVYPALAEQLPFYTDGAGDKQSGFRLIFASTIKEASMKMNEDSSLSIEFNHMDEFKAIYDTIDILRKEVA